MLKTFICNEKIYKYIIFNSFQDTPQKEVWFTFQKTKYIYDAEEKKRFQPLNFPIDLTIRQFMEWKGYPDENEIKISEQKYGKNT